MSTPTRFFPSAMKYSWGEKMRGAGGGAEGRSAVETSQQAKLWHPRGWPVKKEPVRSSGRPLTGDRPRAMGYEGRDMSYVVRSSLALALGLLGLGLPSSSQADVTHTVARGHTIEAIAHRYHVSVKS